MKTRAIGFCTGCCLGNLLIASLTGEWSLAADRAFCQCIAIGGFLGVRS